MAEPGLFDNEVDAIAWLALRGGLSVAYFLRVDGDERALVIAGLNRADERRQAEAKEAASYVAQAMAGKGGGSIGSRSNRIDPNPDSRRNQSSD